MPDHVHMRLQLPPKYVVSQVVDFIKGKSAIHLARIYDERRFNFGDQYFWAHGYFVSTVGRDTELIRQYIREQEAQDRRIVQLQLLRGIQLPSSGSKSREPEALRQSAS